MVTQRKRDFVIFLLGVFLLTSLFSVSALSEIYPECSIDGEIVGIGDVQGGYYEENFILNITVISIEPRFGYEYLEELCLDTFPPGEVSSIEISKDWVEYDGFTFFDLDVIYFGNIKGKVNQIGNSKIFLNDFEIYDPNKEIDNLDSSCEESGYSCREIYCDGEIEEQAPPGYTCPKSGEGNRPVVCCMQKEFSDTGIFLNKDTYFQGDALEVNLAFNEFLDCEVSISPSSEEFKWILREKSEQYNRGGGWKFPDLFLEVSKRLDSSDLSGKYFVSAKCLNEDLEASNYVKEFSIVGETRESFACEVNTNEESVCNFLGEEYSVSFISISSEEVGKVKFVISSEDISEEVIMTNSIVSDEESSFILSNGVILTQAYRAASAPYAGFTMIAPVVQNSCSGCVLEDECYPYGFRLDEDYCSVSGEFVMQFEDESICANHFECGSNLCIDNQCVESGLFTRIANWFRNLFG